MPPDWLPCRCRRELAGKNEVMSDKSLSGKVAWPYLVVCMGSTESDFCCRWLIYAIFASQTRTNLI